MRGTPVGSNRSGFLFAEVLMAAPDEVETLNFADFGIRWTIRQTSGERLRFFTLQSLRDAIDDGEVDDDHDQLSFDGESWRRLSDISDLRAYFWGVFTRHRLSGLTTDLPIIDQGGIGIEDDAPTTIAMPNTMLSAAIQEALARELAARIETKSLPPTPPPAAPPAPQPAPNLIEYALVGAGSVVLIAGLSLWLGG
jgi:hypothetical protein